MPALPRSHRDADTPSSLAPCRWPETAKKIPWQGQKDGGMCPEWDPRALGSEGTMTAGFAGTAMADETLQVLSRTMAMLDVG